MQYFAPQTIEDAINYISAADGDTRILAGGTDLIVQMSAGIRCPDHVVDFKSIDAVRKITTDPTTIRIGAAVSAAEIHEHSEIKALCPGFHEAMGYIGSMQVQSRATPIGNLCNASPAADSVPAMVAARATVTVVGKDGEREVPVEAIPVAPGKTSLRSGEMITSLNLPKREALSGDAYLRFTPRSEMDIAVFGAAVNLSLDSDGFCRNARIALGAVGPTVVFANAAAEALIGTRIDEIALENAAKRVTESCNPIDDKRASAEYRLRISGHIFNRAARTALQRAKQ